MNCRKCGKMMPDGARFCISCGAEHDANGQLVSKNAPIDYNKTMMANDSFIQNGSGAKVDYNKTMMANDSFIQQNNRSKVDYNKTMMANDVPQVNQSQNMNSGVGTNGKSNQNVKVKKKKVSPVLIIVLLLLVASVAFKVVLPMLNKKEENIVTDGIAVESSTVQEVVAETGNVVEDFDASAGYWSKDAESFYKNGTKVKNAWQGDFYLGSDGKKVKNELIDDTFYVDANGKKLKNQWYRFTKKINGKETVIWYYMGPDGAKLRDTITPDGYYVDIDGIYIPHIENNTPNAPNYDPNN